MKFRLNICIIVGILCAVPVSRLEAQQAGQYTVSSAWNAPAQLLFEGEFYPGENFAHWNEESSAGGGSISVSKFDDQNGTRRLTKVRVQIYGASASSTWDINHLDGIAFSSFGLKTSYWRDDFPVISKVQNSDGYGPLDGPTSGSLSAGLFDTIVDYTDQASLDFFTGSGVYSIEWDGGINTWGEGVIVDPESMYQGGMQGIFSGFLSVTYHWEELP